MVNTDLKLQRKTKAKYTMLPLWFLHYYFNKIWPTTKWKKQCQYFHFYNTLHPMVIRQNTITGYYCINCSISVKLTFDISKHCSVGNKTRMLQLKWQNILLSSHWSSAVSSWNWAELWIIPETTVHCLTTADTIATYAPCPADCSSIDNASKTAFHNRRQHHSVSDLSIQHTCIKCKFSNNNLLSIII